MIHKHFLSRQPVGAIPEGRAVITPPDGGRPGNRVKCVLDCSSANQILFFPFFPLIHLSLRYQLLVSSHPAETLQHSPHCQHLRPVVLKVYSAYPLASCSRPGKIHSCLKPRSDSHQITRDSLELCRKLPCCVCDQSTQNETNWVKLEQSGKIRYERDHNRCKVVC